MAGDCLSAICYEKYGSQDHILRDVTSEPGAQTVLRSTQ